MEREEWDIEIPNERCPYRTQNHAYCMETGTNCSYDICSHKKVKESEMKKEWNGVNSGGTRILCA